MARRNHLTAVRTLLSLVDEAYDHPAWHGPNLRSALRGISAAMAARAPQQGRHSVREIVLHAAYWKHQVRLRLSNSKAPRFPVRGHNWFSFSGGTVGWNERAWKSLRALLDAEHQELRRTIACLRDAQLGKPTGPQSQTIAGNVVGIALHDVYHAGQIQLVKRLLQARRVPPA